jgi:hypothetical protein
MRVTRPALCLALVGSLTAVGAASAATKPKPKPLKPVCNLVTDDKGDASITGFDPSNASTDILSGDIASNAKVISAVIRLAAKPSGTNLETGQQAEYYFEFTAPGSDNPQYFDATVLVGTGSVSFSTGQITPSPGGSTYTPDAANGVTGSISDAGVLRMNAPLSAFSRVKLTPGVKLTGLKAETFGQLGVLLSPMDSADGTKYVAGYPSCLKPGL